MPEPTEVVTPVGAAVGAPMGVADPLALGPVPSVFYAATDKVYVVPLVSPLTLALDPLIVQLVPWVH